MPVSILSRTISSVEDKRLVLGNAEAMRLIGVGDDWEIIRVGVRLSMNPSSFVSITGTPQIALGLCSGDEKGFLSPLGTHFWGDRISFATFTATSGTPDHYATSFTQCKKVGTTITNVGSAHNVKVSAAPATHASLWVVQLKKVSGPSLQVGGWSFAATGGPPHITVEQFIETMEHGGDTLASFTPTDSVAHASFAYSTASAIDEATDGPLNAVNIAWDRSLHQLEVSDIAWRKIS